MDILLILALINYIMAILVDTEIAFLRLISLLVFMMYVELKRRGKDV